MMRIVVVVFAAFLTLGLAAFGVVAAQRANAPGSHIAMAAKVEPVSPRPVENPVSQIAQAPVAEPAQAPAIPQAPAPAAPIRVAQNTPAPAPAAAPASPPAPAPAPAPAKGGPACDKPDG